MVKLIENLNRYSTHNFREKYKRYLSKITDKTLRKLYDKNLSEFINLFESHDYLALYNQFGNHKLNNVFAFHPLKNDKNAVILYTYDKNGKLDFIDIYKEHDKSYSNSNQKNL